MPTAVLAEMNSLAEIQEVVEMLLDTNDHLAKENEIFTAYLNQNAPAALKAMEQESNASGPHGGRSVGVGAGGGLGKAKGRRGRDRQAAVVSLKPEQKFDVSVRYLEMIRDEINAAEIRGEKLLASIRAVLEETDLRCAEVRKDNYEFRRDIANGALNPRTGKPVAEKVIRYEEERLRAKEALIEKLRLKNTAFKASIAKVELQLSQKEEMGELLHAIDFDQLKIENQQYLEKIEERNQELLKLKFASGNTVQILNSYKKKLSTLTNESSWLTKEIKSRREALSKIVDEGGRVKAEKTKANTTWKRLKTQQEDYKVPHVLDYVKQKAEMYELQKKVKDWDRKVEIAEMSHKRHRSLARSMGIRVVTSSLSQNNGSIPASITASPELDGQAAAESVDGTGEGQEKIEDSTKESEATLAA